MPIIATTKGNDFELPPEGLHNCVCVDVEDLGLVENLYMGTLKIMHKVTITFMSDQKQKNGKNVLISKRYTLSTHEKSTLRADIKSWRGKDLTDQQAKEFDVETLIGVPCQVIVSHLEKDGKVFSRLEKILKPAANAAAIDFSQYTRKIKRQDYKTPEGVIKMRNSMSRGQASTDQKADSLWPKEDLPPFTPEEQAPSDDSDLPF